MITLAAFMILAQQCAPDVAPATMAAVVRAESAFNPYAIGVVHGRLLRQPRRLEEAVASARALDASGWNFSAGLAQINRANWRRFGLSAESVFEPCRNLAVGAMILRECFARAQHAHADVQDALRASLSCYASGDFTSGYRTGYVQRVVAGATKPLAPVPVIGPVIEPVIEPPIEPDIATIPVVPLEEPARRAQRARLSAVPAAASTSRAGPSTEPSSDLPSDPAHESAVVF
jgi:type IV secretion system protein VirB1